jgi:hypothetical protein
VDQPAIVIVATDTAVTEVNIACGIDSQKGLDLCQAISPVIDLLNKILGERSQLTNNRDKPPLV